MLFTWGNALTMACDAEGVQNRLARIIFSSRTLWSLRTLTALTMVLPVPKVIWLIIIGIYKVETICSCFLLIIGYMRSTFLSDISSGNLAYTTLASWVSWSESIKIFPILIERQQSRRPWPVRSIWFSSFQGWEFRIKYLLHCFTTTDNTNTTVSLFILKSFIWETNGSYHSVRFVRKLIQTFLNYKTNLTINEEHALLQPEYHDFHYLNY